MFLADITHIELSQWLEEVRELCEPNEMHLCSGSEMEAKKLCEFLCQQGSMIRLNEHLRPESYLVRSSPEDVARVESKTYICSPLQEESGPTNNWKDPHQMRLHLRSFFKGCMRGRCCYVLAFCMGPLDSPLARFGVQVTDSPYVVLNMRLMTRMGEDIWKRFQAPQDLSFTKGWHSVGKALEPGEKDVPWPCNPKELVVAHFPQDLEIMSFGSGYGGNALLGKKRLALRIASSMAKKQGWLAEHMFIMSLTSPEGKSYYVAGALPSSCGKTNLAMMQPSLPGWKVKCLGDDIAWMWVDEKGQLRAMNPELGFFGVAPGTSDQTNPVAMRSIEHHTLFTNMALTTEGDVWWEGLPRREEKGPLIDWLGQAWPQEEMSKAVHPNARFTVSIKQCPILDEAWNDPEGVPISTILFGGRRTKGMPLVLQAHDWTHGVLMGASLSSEITAAAEGVVGEMRRDPFAMLPFCGYHMGEYFAHWLEMGKKLKKEIPIFYVNWFLKDNEGRFLWPGYGENVRVLKWMIERLEKKHLSCWSPVGILPFVEELDLSGLSVRVEDRKSLFEIDRKAWLEECKALSHYFKRFEPKFPAILTQRLSQIVCELNNNSSETFQH